MTLHHCPWTFTLTHRWLSVTPLVITAGAVHEADGCLLPTTEGRSLTLPVTPLAIPGLIPHPNNSAITSHSLRLPAAPAWWWRGTAALFSPPQRVQPASLGGGGGSSLEQLLTLGCSPTFLLPLVSPPTVFAPVARVGLQCRCHCKLLMGWWLLCISCSPQSPCHAPRDSDGDRDGDGRSWLFPCPWWSGCPKQKLPDGAQHGCNPSFGPHQQKRSNKPKVG